MVGSIFQRALRWSVPALFFLLNAALAGAALDPVGGFPRLDPSARGTGLGGNMVAVGNGSEALLSNPSGLMYVDSRELEFTYSDLFSLGLVRQTVVQFAWPRMGKEIRWEKDRFRQFPPPPARQAIGVAVSNLRADAGDGAYHETQIALAYAWRLPVGLLAGADYRFLTAGSALATTGGSGHALDFGLTREIGSFRLGLSAANLVSIMNWDEEGGTRSIEDDAPLPLRWSAGLAYGSCRWPVLVLAQVDLKGSSAALTQTGFGLEWRPHPVLALRGALRQREDEIGSRNEWSAGAGFRLKEIHIDYGWQQSAHSLGQTHRWSAGVAL